MKHFMKFIVYSSLAAVLFLASACDMFNVDAEDSPNALTPAAADANFFVTSVQLGARALHATVNNNAADLVRMTHFFGPTYINGFAPSTFNGTWSTAYATILEDANALIVLAEERNLYLHAAIAKIIKAHTAATMVDLFGEVPFSEANTSGILNPKVDSGSEVYTAALALLDDALADLSNATIPPVTVDLFYNGNVARWRALANTLKIRLLVNQREVSNPASAINTILATGEIIDTKAEDFQFKYSTNLANPDSRHPDFAGNYDLTAGEYIAHDYMNRFYANNDPRLRYYFYRQVKDYSGANLQSMPCVAQTRPANYPAESPFCQIGDGYWGRDHGDAGGIPPDNLLRTTYGIYPVGGKFDDNEEDNVGDLGNIAAGAQGAGIEPIFLSSFTHFVLAEADVTVGITGDAATYLEAGIRQSMDKVLNFNSEIGYSFTDVESALLATEAQVDVYVSNVMTAYNAANDAGKLAIIISEYHKAAWGSGLEIYNAYRRTGYPANLQPAFTPDPGTFMNSFVYPLDHVTRNSNAVQRAFADRVFWAPQNLNLK